MRLPTVKIRNDKTGRVIKINRDDWLLAINTGQYRNYSLFSEQMRGVSGEQIDVKINPDSEFAKPTPQEIETPLEATPTPEPETAFGSEPEATPTPEPETAFGSEPEIPTFNIGKMSREEIVESANTYYGETLDDAKHLLTLRKEFNEIVGAK